MREKGGDGYCYRGGDSVKKALTRYQKHSRLTSMGSDEAAGMFKEDNGCTVYIEVPSPWRPAKGGEITKNTIVVMKQ